MRLVTVSQAARELHVSARMIRYWVQTDRLQRYPYVLAPITAKVRKRTVSPRTMMVDIDEARLLRRADAEDRIRLLNSNKKLLRPQEVAKMTGRSTACVYQWVNRYNLHKHKTGLDKSYLIDGDELADALEANGLAYLSK